MKYFTGENFPNYGIVGLHVHAWILLVSTTTELQAKDSVPIESPHHTTPHRIASHRIASHRIASHHITSHHITSHHVDLPCLCAQRSGVPKEACVEWSCLGHSAHQHPQRQRHRSFAGCTRPLHSSPTTPCAKNLGKFGCRNQWL